MTREQIILSYIKRDGLGVEIGAGCAPIAPKKQGFRVHVLDHCDKKALIEKYRPHGTNVDKIEEVDSVWDGRSYTELIGRRHVYDWVIGSHVLEHTTDLIGFLNDCDPCYARMGCFHSQYRIAGFVSIVFGQSPESGGSLTLRRQKIHSPGSCVEYFLTVVKKGARLAWSPGPGEKDEYAFVHSIAEEKKALGDVGEGNAYLDIHEWCFTPNSFRLMMRDLFELGLVQLKELSFHPPVGHEFYMTLSRRGQLPRESRLELMQRVLEEQAATCR